MSLPGLEDSGWGSRKQRHFNGSFSSTNRFMMMTCLCVCVPVRVRSSSRLLFAAFERDSHLRVLVKVLHHRLT